MFTDTHTHPYYSEDPVIFINNALNAGVDHMIMPNVDMSSLPLMKDLCHRFPKNLRMAVGLHPTEVKEDAETVLRSIIEELEANPEYIAVGEIGLDFYWDKTFALKQADIFERQLDIAKKKNLPVIVHSRDAMNETIEIIKEFKGLRGVFHSFGGSEEDARKIMEQCPEFYFGINGIVTFKNSNLREVIKTIPCQKIVLETDSPYLAPVPYRGKSNQSAYLPYIADVVAQCYDMTLDKIAEVTRKNSLDLFGF